jgi:Holliday junction DNA helicase RuvA
MISYLKGKILLKRAGSLILETGGVGYKVFVGEAMLSQVKEGQERELFCYLYLREDRMELYGFSNPETLRFFEVLNTISGIGPKAALALSSLGSIDEFKKAIEQKNERFFSTTKGIGKKKIQKIIVELTGKLDDIETPKSAKPDDALDSLVALGFSKSDARQALSHVSPEITQTEQRIKEALKFFGRR